MNRILAGAAAGALATLPMSAAMGAMFAQLPRREKYPLPPREITDEVLNKAGLDRAIDDRAVAALTLVSHFTYGAECGAVYGAVENRIPGPAFLKGVGYGLAVWGVSYLGWIPAAGILKPATEHPARRNALMIAAHMIWGAALSAVYKGLRRTPEPARARPATGPRLVRGGSDNMYIDDEFLKSVESPSGAPRKTEFPNDVVPPT
ncbi:MAG TPA: DUF1440 domain-containing protein [Bdellovibrionales bacterium]|nr:DUF1440 domain-containing protein [Bdellovibrionales bacterium]